MCIIIHKKAGAELDLDTIQRCWERNPHGAGFMFAQDGMVYGNKGYMSLNALLQGLTDAGFIQDGKFTQEHAVTIHFRLASHGSVKPSNCHPFPITDNLAILKVRYWEANIGLAHNGIIPIKVKGDISDTMTYIKEVLHEMSDRLESKGARKKINKEIAGSRLFVLYDDGSYLLFGQWVEDKGVLYSNQGYKPPERRPVIFNNNYLLEDLDWQPKVKKEVGKRPPAPPGMKWITAK